MKNEYEIRGDVTAIFIDSPKYGRMETLISTEKLNKVREFPNTWCLKVERKIEGFYAFGFLLTPGERQRTTVSLHRWITQSPKKMVVDHINHQTLDNTDGNLRVVTQSENMQNRKGATKTSTSGIRGVSWRKVERKWQAHIRINGKMVTLGLFEKIEDAEICVNIARKEFMPYSQEGSYDNRCQAIAVQL